MKSIFAFVVLFAVLNTHASKQEVRDSKIRKAVEASIDKALPANFKSKDEKLGAFYESKASMKIIRRSKVNGQEYVTVFTKADLITVDYNYGDETGSVVLTCTTTVKKINSRWKASQSKCRVRR